ncbi:MAG: YeeE/YedE family protein [Pseudomonadota bacterium]
MEWNLPGHVAAFFGLIGGVALGAAARFGKFCTLAAIEDVLFGGNTWRWRMWVLAMAVAIGLTQLAGGAGLIDIGQSFYVQRPFNLLLLLVGGLMFGFGMALVGTCAFGTVVRMGGGDLKFFVVFLVTGISAYMAAAGPTAQLRVWLFDPFAATHPLLSDPRVDQILFALAGIPPWTVAAGVSILLVAWVLSDRAFRERRQLLLWGIFVGAIIAFGWVATGWLSQDAFEPQAVVSFSFVQPLGASVMYVMTSSGSTIGFGIGSVVGVLLGSGLAAVARKEWRWEAADDAVEARRQIIGGVLMGTGGMYALGCTIGQGLTAVSALTLSAPIVLAAIWFGAWLGLSYLLSGSVREWLGLLVMPRS